MNGVSGIEPDGSEFVEVDPTGRYGRYNEILGKGASKTVYRAFDEYEGIEVAWNQVKLTDFLQSPEDLERLYREIHLLRTLKHKNIMKFYTSWVDTDNRNINFVTEMFTSGTLRQYRLKHKRVNIRAVKHWCRQILKGLLYLHNHYPPIIHRDLKCDNIFINGNQGQVKIGDLGLAAILRKSYAARCVGTPEFMAPEIYEEEYNELVDIYSFGMCILEMVTFEYPYSECNHPAQIYKKVISGKKPEALYKVKDPEVRQFVEKCLVTVSRRLPARELLKDPFLQFDDYGSDLKPLEYYSDHDEIGPHLRQPLYSNHQSSSSLINGYSHYPSYEPENELDYNAVEFEASEVELFNCEEDVNVENLDITIKGRRREDDGIFLRLRIADREGRIRNIYFPFDIDTDTGLIVAVEMVDELDMTDQHVNKIADMIDAEISNLVPEWKKGLETGTEDDPTCPNASFCQNCASSSFRLDYVSSSNAGTKNLQVLQCSKHGCAAVHGRFEEITYQVEGSEQCSTEVARVERQSDNIHYADIWARRDAPDSSSPCLRDIHCNEAHNVSRRSVLETEEKIISVDNQNESCATYPYSGDSPDGLLDDYENEIRQELRWLKAKYEMQLRELKDQQLGLKPKSSSSSPQHKTVHMKENGLSSHSVPKNKSNGSCLEPFPFAKNFTSYFPINAEKRCANVTNKAYPNAASGSCSPEPLVTAKSFYTYAGDFLPMPLHRASSLPVDAVDF